MPSPGLAQRINAMRMALMSDQLARQDRINAGLGAGIKEVSGTFVNALEAEKKRRDEAARRSEEQKAGRVRLGIGIGAAAGGGALSGALLAPAIGVTAGTGALIGGSVAASGAGAVSGLGGAGLSAINQATETISALGQKQQDDIINFETLEDKYRNTSVAPSPYFRGVDPTRSLSSQGTSTLSSPVTNRAIGPVGAAESDVGKLGPTLRAADIEQQVKKSSERLRSLSGVRKEGEAALARGDFDTAVQLADIFERLQREVV